MLLGIRSSSELQPQSHESHPPRPGSDATGIASAWPIAASEWLALTWAYLRTPSIRRVEGTAALPNSRRSIRMREPPSNARRAARSPGSRAALCRPSGSRCRGGLQTSRSTRPRKPGSSNGASRSPSRNSPDPAGSRWTRGAGPAPSLLRTGQPHRLAPSARGKPAPRQVTTDPVHIGSTTRDHRHVAPPGAARPSSTPAEQLGLHAWNQSFPSGQQVKPP